MLSRKRVSSKAVQKAFKSPVIQKLSPVQSKENDAEKIASLEEKEKALDIEIKELADEGHQESELEIHIDALHKYNEIKDVAQMVMGRLAELEGVTVKEIHQQYGFEDED